MMALTIHSSNFDRQQPIWSILLRLLLLGLIAPSASRKTALAESGLRHHPDAHYGQMNEGMTGYSYCEASHPSKETYPDPRYTDHSPSSGRRADLGMQYPPGLFHLTTSRPDKERSYRLGQEADCPLPACRVCASCGNSPPELSLCRFHVEGELCPRTADRMRGQTTAAFGS
ncbi:MAG: hypothetical protein J3Q66DRAFT_79498 [Benniella sp.]|nr:MAG: hypothetical protein J3Q66DRAFT_79498 [Benniella sp.]